jgi:DNA mismatch repair protein MutS2
LKLRGEAYEEATRIVKEARRQAAAIIRELKDAEESRAADAIRAELAGAERELRAKVTRFKTGGGTRKPFGVFSPGDWIIVRGTATKGQVVNVEEEKSRATVKFGSVTAKVDLTDLEPAAPEKSAGTVKAPETPDLSATVDLIGLRVEDAVIELDKYLDQALLANLPSVEIVHGHGTGALRDGIRRFLKTHGAVKNFGPGPNGNEGVTIAVLR